MKSTAVFNPVLSALFNGYFVNPADYVGLRLAPLFRTSEQSAEYPVFGRENFVSVPNLRPRAPGTPFQRSVSSLSGDKYSTKNYGHESPVPDEVRKKYAKQIDADNAAIKRNAHAILVNHEIRVRDLYLSAAVTHKGSPNDKWDVFADSDPLGDVKAAMRVIELEGGLTPNLMTLTQPVADKLALHPAIRELYPTHNGPITTEMLRIAFQIEEVQIAKAKISTAADGQPLSIGYLWGDDVILSVSKDSQDLDEPNAARTFAWSEESGGDVVGSKIETYRNEETASDIHRSAHHTDEKLTGPDFVYVLTNVLAA